MNWQKKIYGVWGCIISGLLAAAAFSTERLWPINFLALIPFFLVLWKENNTKRKLLLYTISYGVSYYSILLYWLFILTPVFPVKISAARILVAIGIIFIGIINSMLLAIPICLFPSIRQNNAWDIVILSFLYIIGEWMQEILLPVAFPWGRLGVAVTPFTSFLQSASLFGSLFISFLVLLTNGIAAYIFYKIKGQGKGSLSKKDVYILSGILILLFTNTIGGCIRISGFSKGKADIQVLLVQGNHSGLSKWNTSARKILEDYMNLTLDNLTEKTKIVIWPETAIPVYLQEEEELKERLVKICRENQITLLTGAFMREAEEGEVKEYNALFEINDRGVENQAYHKQILVPFGEYLPFEKILFKLLPELTDNINEQLSITPGTQSRCFDTPHGKVGGIICYESIFSSIAGNTIAEGAEIFTVVSNDSWFADSAALYEHHAHSIMRGVEYNRYLLRASNTAITSVISPIGKVIAAAEPFKKTALSADAAFIKKDTLYSKVGDCIIIPGILLCIVSVIKSIKPIKMGI